jgi:glycerol-3-phosphate O-acyltransferase/dihydroxyacetone phosphate acyltransferase
MKKGGPVYDTWDDISQHKALYGLMSVSLICVLVIFFTWRFTPFTVLITPAFLWMSMRWIEDGVATFRAFTALYRLLLIGKSALKNLRERRSELHSRVTNLAVDTLGLPEDPEKYFASVGGKEKGRVRGNWDHVFRYFSVKRRRKRDWNETLRLYDKVDYPIDDYPHADT